MPRILVNCHGGRVAAVVNTFIVPAGVSIHFYIADGALLPNANGWHILLHRLEHQVGNPGGMTTRGPGTVCQEYYGVPYPGLDVANGIQLERNGTFETILAAGAGQNWGLVDSNTINVQSVVLPSVSGGAPYARSVVTLSDIASCPGVTDVDWISCRELW